MEPQDKLARASDLPRYRCHKVVNAAKISSVNVDPARRAVPFLGLGDSNTRDVSQKWIDKHDPKEGGYFVIYDDGYESFSPAEAFEQGYKKVDNPDGLSELEQEWLGQFFVYEHLRPDLKAASAPFAELARFVATLPKNPERTVALRKLLEAKDCAVRALLGKDPPRRA